MKIFVGQKVTGENSEKLKKFSNKIIKALEKKGHSVYCNLFGKGIDERSPKEQMANAFREIDSSDIFLAIIKNNKKSERMIMEIGYVIARGKRLIVAIKSKFKDSTYIPEMANDVIIFESDRDLLNKLKEIK